MLAECKRLLLCNGAHLGDLILSTAVLPVLKAMLPELQIGFLIGSWAKPVIEFHRDVDWIHIFDHPKLNRSTASPKEKKKRGNSTWHQALSEIQEKNYDVAIDLYYFYKANSARLLSQTPIPHRIGFWASPAHYLYTDRLFWIHSHLHMVENHGTMLKEIGAEESHLARLRPILHYKNALDFPQIALQRRNYILVHVGVGDSLRQWNVAAWQKFLLQLGTLGYPLVLVGHGKKEAQLITDICSGLTKAPLNLCDLFPWRGLITLIENAKLLVGLESMAGHVAAAMNTPAVLIYGYFSKMTCWKPYNPLCRVVIVDPLIPRPKNKRAQAMAIHKISSEVVFQAVLEVLSTAI